MDRFDSHAGSVDYTLSLLGEPMSTLWPLSGHFELSFLGEGWMALEATMTLSILCCQF